mmetsp:Transcript_36968/g.85278  ORF Transcript_36968/g.85278 Transcript_36968/m.85278 type:complete len:875 (+) Transcript_36968:82-2706(+)
MVLNGRGISTSRSKRAITNANLDAASTSIKRDEGLFPTGSGKRPWFTPSSVPLDLIFFRRVFSILNQRYGQGTDEVPCAVFQRTVVRLFHMMNFPHVDFNSQDYDVDGSGAVGWYEFVTCWQTSKIRMGLSNVERVFFAMEDPSSCRVGTCISMLITALIFVSCICFMLGTLPSFKVPDKGCDKCEPLQLDAFEILESVSVGVFTLEYAIRAVSAPFSRSELLDYERILEILTEYEQFRKPSPFVRFIVFTLQPMNVVDLLVITPYYVERLLGLVAGNLAVLRVIRLTRLFRLIKLGRYIDVMQLIVRVFRRSIRALNVLYLYLVLGICFSSALMYYVEGGTWDKDLQEYVRESEDGEKDVSPFKSIPHTFWWCVTTFTTTGYGDVTPATALGKVVAACTMLTGLLVLAMPISVISLNFATVWADWNEEKRLEAEALEQDMNSVTEALEVLKSRTRLLVQIFDDDAGEGMKGELLGEVDIRDLPVEGGGEGDKTDTVCIEQLYHMELGAHLLHNGGHHGRRGSSKSGSMTGQLLLGYSWTATPGLDSGISGTLEVRIRHAENLPLCDWREGQTRDVYAVVHCWPKPPPPGPKHDEVGNPVTNSEIFQTSTARGTLNPVWNEKATFEFDWPWNWRPADPVSPSLTAQAPPMARSGTRSGNLGSLGSIGTQSGSMIPGLSALNRNNSAASFNYLGSMNSNAVSGLPDILNPGGRRESAASLSPLRDHREAELRSIIIAQGREMKAMRTKLDDMSEMLHQLLGKENGCPPSPLYRKNVRTRTAESHHIANGDDEHNAGFVALSTSPVIDDPPPPRAILQAARESDQTVMDLVSASNTSPSPSDELPGMNKIIAPPNGHTVPHAPESAPLHLPGEVGN